MKLISKHHKNKKDNSNNDDDKQLLPLLRGKTSLEILCTHFYIILTTTSKAVMTIQHAGDEEQAGGVC